MALLGVAAEYFYSKDMQILGTIFTVGVFIVFIGAFIYLIVLGIRGVISLVPKKRPEKIE